MRGFPVNWSPDRRKVAKQAGVPDNVTNRDSYPAGMIRGGPDRAKVSQKYTLKRLDYSLRMARRLSEDTHQADIDEHPESTRMIHQRHW